ncbi:HNH endonuclease [Caballeronia sp. LZ001]|nr:HNH endonuclease [Caballeronia sp. LZ001]
MRPCRHRGCGALVSGGNSYCLHHARENVKWQPDAVRGNRHARGYGSVWVKQRERILLRDGGLCQVCKRAGRVALAAEVDHRVPRSQGGTDDDENLQSICRKCHATKTGSERR